MASNSQCCYIFKATSKSYPTGDIEEVELIDKNKRIKDSYPSKNVWFFGGRAVGGPDRGVFIYTVVMTAITVAVFLLFEGFFFVVVFFFFTFFRKQPGCGPGFPLQ